ncbi:DUF2798 domain-containing protein (plasmid) [Enterobacter ludwigii]|uniref:DUF2798 domain-containing protein n=1 Tax=Enterobacter ludwigii TaxID=299767 RepID=UPI002B4BB7E4|nr:DUF2798 domain-containing protein [Enterobacter ludwigii]WRM04097.1 DUF2798 domain-containing protein [Enterobacter ludwigii]WRM07052.1 DUF2798 domain-containing protein [Enterobacter ludwigii]
MPELKKLNRKYFSIIFAGIMSFFMSGIISLLTVLFENGFSIESVMEFLDVWKYSFPFAFLIAQIITPLARKITSTVVES